MTIVLKYTRWDGTQEQAEFEDEVSTINLTLTGIADIDLSPLNHCASLKQLNLGENKLQNVDLSPLITCANLEDLLLDENKLQSIDLNSLSTCTDLQSLRLRSNKLQSIDLSPLSTCANLQWLNLSGNHIQNIDLSPLRFLDKLIELDIVGNELRSIDLTPLSFCSKLNEKGMIMFDEVAFSWLPVNSTNAIYQRPLGSYSWSFLREITEYYATWKYLRVQQDILYAMGLQEYGFIDRNLHDLFLSISADTPLEKARELVREVLLDEIIQAIDQQRATTGLNLESVSAKHGEIAKRVPQIIDQRQAEIERTVFEKDQWNTVYEIQELYVTSYGYEILFVLDTPFTSWMEFESFEELKKPFAELGLELKTGESSVSGVRMSDELKDAILWIAGMKGEPWEREKQDWEKDEW